MRKLLVVLVLLLLGVFLVGEGLVLAAPVQRSIEEFVDAQGTYCIDDGQGGCYLIVPPVANFIGWTDPAEGIAASVDYAGLADDCAGGAFGTVTTGTVTERALPDGRAEVHVKLHTTNALSWVVDGDDFANGALLFGHRWDSSDCGSIGGEPALGESRLYVKFINTGPGDPLPDLIQLAFFPEEGQEILLLSFNAQADGPLADGTPGRLRVVQTATDLTDFAAENIILHAVGQ